MLRETQKSEFGTIYVNRNGEPDSCTDGVVVGNGMITLSSSEGKAEYNFTIDKSGTYDVVVQLCFPFWDKNGITIALDGTVVSYSENRLWWPYWRKTFWAELATNVNLLAGTHSITIEGGVVGTQFYGFRVCSNFSEYPSAGEATFSLSPRSLSLLQRFCAVSRIQR